MPAGIKTYFIKTRKADFVSQLMSNISRPTSVSPLLHSRHRLASCSSGSQVAKQVRPHYLHMVTNASSYRIKANSLPSILDSDNDASEDGADKEDAANKSPTSTASYGTTSKKKSGRRPWRYLQRQRTAEEMAPSAPTTLPPPPELEQGLIAGALALENNGVQKVGAPRRVLFRKTADVFNFFFLTFIRTDFKLYNLEIA